MAKSLTIKLEPNKPQVIFDSRHAKSVYRDYNYYRSGGFCVPAGYVAVVELTTHHTFLSNLLFTAIRVPPSHSLDACYGTKNCLGKRYRRWRCYQGLGDTGTNTQFNDFNRSIVRWGNDTIRGELVEHEYIVRPGNYYLIADKCSNTNLEDCNNPTVIDVTLVPVDQLPELMLPGCPTEPTEVTGSISVDALPEVSLVQPITVTNE